MEKTASKRYPLISLIGLDFNLHWLFTLAALNSHWTHLKTLWEGPWGSKCHFRQHCFPRVAMCVLLDYTLYFPIFHALGFTLLYMFLIVWLSYLWQQTSLLCQASSLQSPELLHPLLQPPLVICSYPFVPGQPRCRWGPQPNDPYFNLAFLLKYVSLGHCWES